VPVVADELHKRISQLKQIPIELMQLIVSDLQNDILPLDRFGDINVIRDALKLKPRQFAALLAAKGFTGVAITDARHRLELLAERIISCVKPFVGATSYGVSKKARLPEGHNPNLYSPPPCGFIILESGQNSLELAIPIPFERPWIPYFANPFSSRDSTFPQIREGGLFNLGYIRKKES